MNTEYTANVAIVIDAISKENKLNLLISNNLP